MSVDLPVPLFHQQFHVREERAAAVALREAADYHELVGPELLLPYRPAYLFFDVRPLDRTHALGAGLDGEGLFHEHLVAGAPLVQAGGGLLEALDLLGFLLPLFELLLIAGLLLDGVEAVVAAVELGLSGVYLDDARDDAVEEIAVVRDGQNGPPEVLEVVLEPLGRLHVEVVGRLVEKEDVRLLEDEPREVDARLLSAGEG